MSHVSIDNIGSHIGETVTIKGWLHNRRSSGKIHFLVVRDGTGFLQVVMGRNDVPEKRSRQPITCRRRAR
jgi:asparaginyl-tRNA synthetase